MRVSVVVPAYNEEKLLERCLRSLRSQTADCEIIVCDNNSTDGTARIAKKYADRVLTVKRQGATHAINAGMKSTDADFIAVTGSDCTVPPDWIEKFLRHFRNERVIACYGSVDPLEKRHSRYFSVLNFSEKVCIRLGLWFVIQGANFMARRKVLESVGFFDPRIELFEENALFKKIKSLGKVRFVTNNRIRASVRRVDECGKSHLILLGIRQMFKLSFYKKTDASRFKVVR